MDQELYNNLVCACAVFAIRENYDSMIRKKMDFVTEKNHLRSKYAYAVFYGSSFQVKKNKQLYYKVVNEEIDPAIKQANEEIETLIKKDEEAWQSNQRYLTFLPSRYHTSIATSFMLSAIKNYRADTLKEAINLYETAVAQWKLEKAISDATRMRKIEMDYVSEAFAEIQERQLALQREIDQIRTSQSPYGL
jgi:hypothetical protein